MLNKFAVGIEQVENSLSALVILGAQRVKDTCYHL